MGKQINIRKLGLTLVPLLLIGKFVIQPWLEWVSENRDILQSLQKIETKQRFLISREREIAELQIDIEKQYQNLTVDIATFSNENSLSLIWLQAIETLTEGAEINLSNKKPDRLVKITESIGIFSGLISVKGDPSRIFEFLGTIETDKNFYFRTVDIRKNLRSRSDEMIVEVEIVMMVRKV